MKKLPLSFLSFLFLLILSCKENPSQEQLILSIPDPKTLNETYVSNPDEILSRETVEELNAKLSRLDQAGAAHIDVVFVKSIGELVPKDVAHELFNTWKVGSKETNNGLLILIVQDQKRIEFETGYGLEGVLPDVICYRIQQEHMIPYAKQNDFNTAVKKGVDAVIDYLHHQNSSPPVVSGSGVAIPDLVAPDTIAYDSASADQRIDMVQPYSMEQPDLQADRDISELATFYKNHEPGNIFSIILAVIYFAFTLAMVKILAKKWYHGVGLIIILFILPLAVILYLNLNYPISWYNVRGLLFLYGYLLLYFHIHFLLLSHHISSIVKDKTRHEQYLKWRDTFTSLMWITKLFPFPLLKLFWKKHLELLEDLRYNGINCDNCKTPMLLQNEDKDNEYLSAGQSKEEDIGSVDYDVWSCNTCNERVILDYRDLKSKAKECSKCHFITASISRNKVIYRATRSKEGLGRTYFVCVNCRHEDYVEFVIPQISDSGSSSSSSSSSGSSSSSSSSGSSSSSSSSGGSSGGGGAGSSW